MSNRPQLATGQPATGQLAVPKPASPLMETPIHHPTDEQLDAYANLIVNIGINLQEGQGLTLAAEHEHAPFVYRIARAAYRAGACIVDVIWRDDLLERQRALESRPEHLEYVPDYLVDRARVLTDLLWPQLILTGQAHPHALNDIDASTLTRMRMARVRKTRFLGEAQMADKLQWCIAGVPTQAWAQQVFPTLPPADALARLWQTILMAVRIDTPDPLAAWQAHASRLDAIANTLNTSGIRTIHFLDPTPGPDGKPSTDLSVRLTDDPIWISAGSATPQGHRFLPNLPSEEIFTTPHRLHAEGYTRTSKPNFLMGQPVDGAWFRFQNGEVTDFHAEAGDNYLREFFRIPGANRLGEIALVDERSPINRTGLIFHDILFDENCVCHIAFGQAYPRGMRNGDTLSPEERTAAGINEADVHSDFMIGSPTMCVTGIHPNGTRLPIIIDGQFIIGNPHTDT